VLADGRRLDPGAEETLVALAQDPLRPAVVRATAVELLAAYPGPGARAGMERALSDPEPLVRAIAAEQIQGGPAELARCLGPLLQDPVRTVRAQAAARLAGTPALALPGTLRQAQAAALEEHVEAQRYMSDLPSGSYDLGNLYAALGRPADAETQYRRALQIDGRFFPAQANLARLLAGQGRLEEAEGLLREARSARPSDAGLSFNLGLLLAERGNRGEAEQMLRAALQTDPRMAAAAYDLALLLGERRVHEALALARKATALRPEDPRYAWTLGYFQVRAGDLRGATVTLEALVRDHPDYDDGWPLLAEVYARQGRSAEAEQLARRRPRPRPDLGR
jgi:Flp pilus assembly protein TadD